MNWLYPIIPMPLRFILLVVLFTACTPPASSNTPPPTLLSAAELPPFVTPIYAEEPPVTLPPPVTDNRAPTPTAILVAGGKRPSAIQQQFLPDAGPAQLDGYRPPPISVPLSRHPDDHYWLMRPIPSGSRNYDLEWYPFGNDVMVAKFYPYRIHHGADFPNEPGTPVLAAGSGTVVHAGPRPSPRTGVNYYGNTVIIKHDWQWRGQDVYTLYAHTLELFVHVGDHVEAGELIAGVGSSGGTTGPHLHFEVRIGQNHYGYTQNPALWLAPYVGWGTLAGRFEDKEGELISDALISLEAITTDAPDREQRTYHPSIHSDDVWNENFVIGDLPNGRYRLTINYDNTEYKQDVTIRSGQTTFSIVAADFVFHPTATPLPTATAVPTTAVITTTATITTTTTMTTTSASE